MMKVLFLQHALGYGGATKSLLLMQKALRNDIDIYTIVPKLKTNKQKAIIREFKDSLDVTEMDIPTIYSYSERVIPFEDFERSKNYFPKNLIEYINKLGIDILHVNSTLYSHILEPIKRNTSCKIVVHLREMLPHGIMHPIDNFIIDNYSKHADAIISISDNELQFFSVENKTYIIPNLHDFEQTDKLLTQINNKEEGKIIVGMCANFVRIKGHFVFLEVANILDKNNLANIEFRIIGYPNNKFSIKNMIARLINYGYKSEFDNVVKNLKLGNIKILPFSFDVYDEINAFDIYIRPDLSGHPWGRDVIEAMALKKPVIATGKSEFYIENGINGYLVQPNDPEAIAEKIIKLISSPSDIKKMGVNGYRKVKNMCDVNNYKKHVLEIYHTVSN